MHVAWLTKQTHRVRFRHIAPLLVPDPSQHDHAERLKDSYRRNQVSALRFRVMNLQQQLGDVEVRNDVPEKGLIDGERN